MALASIRKGTENKPSCSCMQCRLGAATSANAAYSLVSSESKLESLHAVGCGQLRVKRFVFLMSRPHIARSS